MKWLLHVMGIDTQQSYFYDFWSGIGTQFTVLLAGAGAFHKHKCHKCLRIGKHVINGTPYCQKHHPEGIE